MTLLPSINSINLLPHAVRHSTNALKRKWLPLRNYKVHFLKIQAKKQKKSYTVSGVPKTLPRWKIHPWLRFIYSDILRLHSWILFPSIIEKGVTCTMFLLEGAHWKPSIQSFTGGDERNGYHVPSHCMVGKKSHCMVGKSLRLQGGQQVSSINHTVHTNQWGTPNCAYWMGKGGFNTKSRSPEAGRPSER